MLDAVDLCVVSSPHRRTWGSLTSIQIAVYKPFPGGIVPSYLSCFWRGLKQIIQARDWYMPSAGWCMPLHPHRRASIERIVADYPIVGWICKIFFGLCTVLAYISYRRWKWACGGRSQLPPRLCTPKDLSSMGYRGAENAADANNLTLTPVTSTSNGMLEIKPVRRLDYKIILYNLI